jgi:predicted Fe-Mo cluster-binding NifX family protein
MRIAFTANGTTLDSMIEPRFGRTECIVVYDEETKELKTFDNSAIKEEAHDAGTATVQKLYEIKPDVLITGNGPVKNAAAALKHMKIQIFVNAHNMTLKQAYQNYKSGTLKELSL